jgi:hypothetical protein
MTGGDLANADAVANTLADIPGLSFPVVTGTRYGWRARIRYGSAASTTGARFAANGPTASLIEVAVTQTISTAAAMQSAVAAWNVGILTATAVVNATNLAYVEGECVPTANGTVQIRFASEISASAITVIEAGSWLEWWTIT